jgi:hypothetical protein
MVREWGKKNRNNTAKEKEKIEMTGEVPFKTFFKIGQAGFGKCTRR